MLRPLLCAAALAAAGAFFADDVGVNDRAETRAGPPNFVAAAGRSLLVSTDAGVAAALSQRTGDVAWRAVLPDGASEGGTRGA